MWICWPGLIRASFADVAGRFDLTPENAPTHPSNCTPEWILTAMGKGVAFLLLESPQGAVGCVAVERADREVCYLERLAVLPEYRRKGHGRELVGHAPRSSQKPRGLAGRDSPDRRSRGINGLLPGSRFYFQRGQGVFPFALQSGLHVQRGLKNTRFKGGLSG